MITRRQVLASTAQGAALFAAGTARAQAYREKFPEIILGWVPAENASGLSDRMQPFVEYLSKELGVKCTLRIAQDYAAVIEGQRAGNIHLANYGAASFARARLTGVKTEAFATDENKDGTHGYFSVFFVKAQSPYQKIEDLKGKVLALVDPNSTSGNNVPRFELKKHDIIAETFFSKVIYAGSHDNAILALAQGTADVCANQWTSEDDSTLQQMITKGLLKGPDGKLLAKTDFRIINKSDPILNGPYAYLESLPQDLKDAITKAFFEAPTKVPAAFARLSDGQKKGFIKMSTKDYDATIELIKFVDSLRKA